MVAAPVPETQHSKRKPQGMRKQSPTKQEMREMHEKPQIGPPPITRPPHLSALSELRATKAGVTR